MPFGAIVIFFAIFRIVFAAICNQSYPVITAEVLEQLCEHGDFRALHDTDRKNKDHQRSKNTISYDVYHIRRKDREIHESA